jgi:hypothetical protein
MTTEALVPYEHVLSTVYEDGDGLLVDLKTKKYYQLNETAVLVWRGLEKGRTVEEIVSEMTSRYDVAPERAAASVERVLREMQSQKLLARR